MGSSRRSAKGAEPVVDAVAQAFDAARAAASSRPGNAPVVVGFSGGLDSTVLLHAAAAALGASRVVAVHVHHGLQPAADAWPGHCADVAVALGVAFESLRVEACPPAGASVEAWARERRYGLLCAAAARLGAAALLTAHHADDQAETLLIRIARGTGPDGLAGIRAAQDRGGVALLRPLLDLPREALLAHARRHRLRWIEDPSNLDRSLLRNAFRHRVLPALDEVAPAFRANLLRMAAQLDEARAAVRALAEIDLAGARAGTAPGRGRAGARDRDAGVSQGDPTDAGTGYAGAVHADAVRADPLDADALAALPAPRRAAALRRWIEALGLRAPAEARLREIERQLLLARGPYGCVAHDGVLLRRHRRTLLATAAPSRPPPGLAATDAGPTASPSPGAFVWRGERSLRLPGFEGRLHFEDAPGGVSLDWLLGRELTVRPAFAGARLRPHPRARLRTLKNLYQELGVPAWERPGLPVVQHGDRVLYAAGVGMDRSAGWPSEGRRIDLRWSPRRV